MAKINLLSSKIYNRIAAGEVIERPSSVVKELVENSIDANASVIEIEIENGGLSTIIITDNGVGIEKDQLKKALLPHATSKISNIKDLDGIKTLGFRGEALPSIASVAKVTIKSKPKEQNFGAEIYAENDNVSEPTECGCLDGTQIIVDNLFFNAPVRAKFLKSERTEEGEITSLVTKFILGNSDVAFKYIVDGKVVLQSYGDGFESAFISVYGINVINDCFYVNVEKNGIVINGYIGKPNFYKANRTYQTVFLNGRNVNNNTISSAISNAYSPFLMKRQYPFYVLQIFMPCDAVDVNVHPNKTDVRFVNNQVIYGTLYSLFSKILAENKDAVKIEVPQAPQESQPQKPLENTNKNANGYVMHIDNSLFDELLFSSSESTEKGMNNSDVFAENKKYLEELEKKKNIQKPVVVTEIKIEKDLKYIGQALNTYLIYQADDDVYFVDQHALHERILFDKINESFEKDDVVTQPFLAPYVFSVNNAENNFLLENLSVLKGMGIEIEPFGDNSFKVSALPIFFADFDIKAFFDEILSDISALKGITAKELLKDKFAQKACKSAIKSGNKIKEEEIKLLTDVISKNLALKCPHGRPVAIKISRTEIDKWFKRIV